jgi:hypothetical protein
MATIVKHPDTFSCDVCVEEYDFVEITEFCETHNPLPPYLGKSVMMVV